MNASRSTAFIATGVAGVIAGAVIGAALTSANFASNNPSLTDRFIGDLRQSALLLKISSSDPLVPDNSQTAKFILSSSQITTTNLGLSFNDVRIPGNLEAAIKALNEINSNPRVLADNSSNGKVAKVARECLLAESAKPKPSFASCADYVSKMWKIENPNVVSN